MPSRSKILSKNTPRPVSGLLDSLPISDKLSRSISVTNLAIPVWEAHIDSSLGKHTQLAHFEDGVLVVTADSPAWANLLHHQQASILAVLHDAGLTIIRHIYIRTTPRQAEPQPEKVSRRPADPDSVTRSLRATANSIEDPEVREALNRLAATLSKPD